MMRASIATTLALGLALARAAGGADDLARQFADPPDSAKPWVYWWWLKGLVTREGITRDLEEMKRQGINGALIFHAGGEAGAMPGGLTFLSPEWRAMFRHALGEAARLGMEVSVNLCDGWDSGGPWIRPEDANKKLVWSEAQFDGPRKVAVDLPSPPVVDGWYRDVAVVAFRDRPDRPPAPAEVVAGSSAEGYCGERNHPPEEAADGDPETCWVAGGGRPAWISFRYGEPIAAVGLHVAPPAGGGPRECELQASADGKTFAPIRRFAMEVGRPQRIDFPETRAREFRLVISSTHGGPARVAEATVLRAGDEPHPRPGIKWWLFKSGNRSFWDDPREGPAVLGEEYGGDDALDCRAADVVDLSEKAAKGRLEWDVPAGRWTVLRFGCTLLGQRTRCGVLLGYEASMLDPAGIERHFAACAEPLLEDAAATGGKALKFLHIDSYELGADVRGQQPTWSSAFREEFRTRRGYDLGPYLPALARRIVGGRAETDRFLWDFRRTIGDLFAERCFGRFAELAHRRGVGVHAETGYGTYPWPHIDGLRCAGMGDATMGEFWHGTDIMSQFDPWGSVIRSVASAAHVYGRSIVQAEAFTSWNHWRESPASLKPAGDEAFCAGLTRMVFHQYTHQPRLDMKPGWQYGAGTHFDRNVTWWEQGRAFFRYLARCQLLLGQGRFVADACYFSGEGVTTFVPGKTHLRPALPPGYDFDGINADALVTRAAVRDGQIVLPGGPGYRLLVIRPDAAVSPPVLRKLEELVRAGATVLGPKPRAAAGLGGWPESDREIARLADAMWGEGDGPLPRERRIGAGRVIEGKTPGEVLAGDGVPPDFEFPAAAARRAGLAGATWIWHAPDGPSPPPCVRLFIAEIEVPADRKVVAACATATADNGFELEVNGIPLLRGDDFREAYDADIARALRPGKNELAIRATNAGDAPNPAALIAKFVVDLDSGPPIVLATGRAGWLSSAGDGRWSAPLAIGPHGCPPWGAVDRAAAPSSLDSIHRTIGDAEVWFVANRGRSPFAADCTFRVAGKRPEIWDPVSGETRAAAAFRQAGGRTSLPLDFAPGGSLFVVFREPIPAGSAGGAARNFPALTRLVPVDGPWTVRFDPAWGGPESATFERLESWPRRPEEGIRHYSGTATYAKAVDISPVVAARKGRLFLDLGAVKEVAQVRWNGKDLGVAWTEPFRVEITGLAAANGNRLEVDVVNLWPNRLIGDAGLPPEKRRTTTNVAFAPGSPLLDSGLLGPVWILAEE